MLEEIDKVLLDNIDYEIYFGLYYVNYNKVCKYPRDVAWNIVYTTCEICFAQLANGVKNSCKKST